MANKLFPQGEAKRSEVSPNAGFIEFPDTLLSEYPVPEMYVLLYDDRRILNDIQFFPGFTEKDAPLRAFVEIVNGMETW